MNKETAQRYAMDALLWLAKDNYYLNNFLISSGANTHDLRLRSKDPEFLSFVLDYFMTSDDLILALSKDLKVSPEKVRTARLVLSGRDLHHWT